MIRLSSNIGHPRKHGGDDVFQRGILNDDILHGVLSENRGQSLSYFVALNLELHFGRLDTHQRAEPTERIRGLPIAELQRDQLLTTKLIV